MYGVLINTEGVWEPEPAGTPGQVWDLLDFF